MTRGVASLRAAAAGLTFLVIGTVAACGSSAAPPASGTGAAAGGSASRAASMATSIASGLDSWAVVPMTADPAFWQVFARAGNSGTWKLVTPPGVPTNGGIVASADGASALTVTVRPSEYLKYSPLAATANGGASWSTAGPIDAAVAASPDSFAADGSHLAALLSDGTIETSSDAGTTWSTLAKPAAIASSPAAKGCGGTVRVTSVSFGISSTEVLAGGTCGASGTAAVFAHSASGGWQRLGLPVSGQLVRLTAEMALIQGKSGLSALWRGFGWYAYAPLTGKTPQAAATNWDESAPLPVSGPVTASGTLPGGGVWVLLPGGRGATVNVPGRGSQEQWTLLPPVPAHTSVLASGPDDSVDALAVSGAKLTVWRLAKASTGWSEMETITVPIQYGSSS